MPKVGSPVASDKVQITGLKATVRGLKRLSKEATVRVKALNRRHAERVAAVARSLAPKGATGKLAKSIRAGAGLYAGYVKAGGAALPYVLPIHFGWPAHNIEPQPFLYEAFDQERAAIIASYGAEMRQIVDETIRGGSD